MRDKKKSDKQEVINRDVSAALRAQQAIQLRAQRLTWQKVADEAGYASPGAARNAVQRELGRALNGDIEEWRREELAMLDELQRILWPLIAPTDPKKQPSLFAMDRLLAISKARREIKGMDSPVQAAPAPTAQVLVQQVNFSPEAI